MCIYVSMLSICKKVITQLAIFFVYRKWKLNDLKTYTQSINILALPFFFLNMCGFVCIAACTKFFKLL